MRVKIMPGKLLNALVYNAKSNSPGITAWVPILMKAK